MFGAATFQNNYSYALKQLTGITIRRKSCCHVLKLRQKSEKELELEESSELVYHLFFYFTQTGKLPVNSMKKHNDKMPLNKL